MAKIKHKKLKNKQNLKKIKVSETVQEDSKKVRRKNVKREFTFQRQKFNLRNQQTNNDISAISDEGNIVFPNPLVMINRCADIENLVSNMSAKYASLGKERENQSCDFTDKSEGAQTVSGIADKPETIVTLTTSPNNIEMESIQSQPVSEVKVPQNITNFSFIRSFKITASLDDKTRKIDVINIPVSSPSKSIKKKRVSMKKRRDIKKVTPPSWLSSVKSQEMLFKNMVNVTSSNILFKSARLEAQDTTPPSGRATPILTLTRKINNSISPPETMKWSSKESVTSTSYESSITQPNKHRMTPRNLNIIQSPRMTIELDCKRSNAQIKSDSSGYQSEQKLSDNSPTSSTLSSPKRRVSAESDRLAFNFNTQPNLRNAVSPLTPKQHQHIQQPPSTVIKRKFAFKTPILPNTKRPPTRIKEILPNAKEPPTRIKEKITASSSLPSMVISTKPKLYTDDTIDNSDAISLYAESCLDVEERCRETEKIQIEPTKSCATVKRPNLDITVPRPYSQSSKTNFITAKSIEKMVGIKRIESPSTKIETLPLPMRIEPPQIRTEPPSIPILNAIQQNSFIEADTSKVNNWIKSTNVSNNFVTTDVLIFRLRRFCYLHYGNGLCKREKCAYYHTVPEDFRNYFRELSESQFQIVLNYMKKIRNLYKDLFDQIISYFKDRNQVDNLIDFIEEILKLNCDKTPYIKKVILALKDMGMNFVEAINEILLTHGRKTQSLLDILLLVIVEEGDCLENNWQLMDKLTKFRQHKLDYGVVSEIFQKCCNTDTPRKDFCENIYKDLIIKSHIELHKIDRDLVIKYVNLLYYFDFDQYAEQVKQNNGIHDYEVQKIIKPNPEIIEEPLTEAKDNSSVTNSNSSNSNNSSPAESLKECPKSEGNKSKNIPAINTLNNIDFEEDGVELDYSYEQEEMPENIDESEDDPRGEKESPNEFEMNDDMRALVEQYRVDERTCNAEIETDNEPLFRNNSSQQNNHSYTNSELDTYLNYVNRDTYTATNYYRSEEYTPIRNKNYNSDASEKFNQIPSSIIERNPVTPRSIKSTTHSTSNCTEHILDVVCSNTFESSEEDLLNIEVEKLVSSIHKRDMSGILHIMNRSATTNKSRSFVAHTISAITNIEPPQARTKVVLDIFDTFASLNHFLNGAPQMRNVLKLFAFNIIPTLDQRREYAVCLKIFSIFAQEMDSFIGTNCIRYYPYLSTLRLRHIFIFKMYLRNNKFKDALKLLKSSNLNLFQSLATEKRDENSEYKKRLLTEFIEITLQKDLHIARETILYLMLNMDFLRFPINLVKYLNMLLVKLLNSFNFKSELLGLIDNISNGWCKYLQHSIMRALLVALFGDLGDRKLMDLFNMCVELKIYTIHEGTENSICIPKNLLPEEVNLLLQCQFSKICKTKFPVNNVLISVGDPIPDDDYTLKLKILTNSHLMDPKDMIRRILNVFGTYPNFPSRDNLTISNGWITIPFDCLKYFASPYHQSGMSSVVKTR